ncbi:vls recombination cassette Vls1 (plasmid) [Borreliella burgdorferi 72a]|nr:variable large family protein [Borreliella burgdorferi]ACM10361.1 vls recombination cassette Vls1 [Borreliella burgdorferi 72a]
MVGAAKKIAKATDGSEVKIGEVGAAANQGAAADQASVNGIADGMKEIVDAGGKGALKAGAAAADNKEAGKLFGGAAAGAGGGASDNDIGKAAAAVNAVSGEQILKAIVDAAAGGASDNDIGKAAAAVNAVSGEQILKAIVDAAAAGGDKVGKAAGDANNPIAAAIGTNDAQGGGANFAAGGGMKNSSEKIAAAIVLRGMATYWFAFKLILMIYYSY